MINKNYKHLKHFYTSSKDNMGVDEAFEEIEKDLLSIKKPANQFNSMIIEIPKQNSKIKH